MEEGGLGVSVSISGREEAAGIMTGSVEGGVEGGVEGVVEGGVRGGVEGGVAGIVVDGVTGGGIGCPALGCLSCSGEGPTENFVPLWSRSCKLSNSNPNRLINHKAFCALVFNVSSLLFCCFLESSVISFMWTVRG